MIAPQKTWAHNLGAAAVVVALGLFLALPALAVPHSPAHPHNPHNPSHSHTVNSFHEQVIVPGEDRFTPFALTIQVGDTVQWINNDTDDHTVVSDDFFNTAGNLGTNTLLPGTDSNHGRPGTFFSHPGTFVYYCRFHAHLDADHQPAAPGPRGGIQDANGNFGTPMMGVITVLSPE